MRKRSIRQRLEQRVENLSKYFKSISNIKQLRTYAYDSVPLEFHYFRHSRRLKLIIGIEIERLLNISRTIMFREHIRIPYQIIVPLRKIDRKHGLAPIAFEEPFYFLCKGYCDELLIEKLPGGKEARSYERLGLKLPKRGFLVRFRELDAAFCVTSLKNISVQMCKVGKAPEIVCSRKDRAHNTGKISSRSIFDPWIREEH